MENVRKNIEWVFWPILTANCIVCEQDKMNAEILIILH